MWRDASFRSAILGLALSIGLVVAVTASVLAGFMVREHEADARRRLEARAREALDIHSRGVTPFAVPHGERTGLRVTVFTPQGAIVEDTQSSSASVNRPEVAAATSSGTGYDRRFDTALAADMRYAAAARPGTPVVRVGERADVADARLARDLRALAAAAAAGWLVCTAIGSFFLFRFWLSAASIRLALNEPKAGFPRGMSGVLGDIAARSEALLEETRTLRQARQKDRDEAGAILASMSEAVLAVDGSLRLRVVNAAAAKLLGLDAATAAGQPIGGVVRQEEISEAAARAAGGNEGSARIDLPGPPPRVVELRAEPIQPLGGAVLVLRDVTEAARFADMRRDFAASASHELRTPLSVIRGTVETLLDGGLDNPAKAREFLEAVERQMKGLTALVNDLLDLGKLESRPEFAPRICDVADILAEAREAHAEAAAKKSLKLEVDAPHDLPRLMADPALLARAFSNLVENAVRYTPAGGSVKITAIADREGVRVAVSDTGIGIPPKDIQRIFERFYRVDKSRSREAGGTGLGLAIVKHIAALHKGEVWAESSTGSGSTFFFYLPGFR